MGWNGLIAEFTDVPGPGQAGFAEKRRKQRLRLSFEANLADARGPSGAVVLDLSQAGFMMHTNHALKVGDSFTVDLPEAGTVHARVVWKRVTLHGCEFAEPVSRPAISATLLKAAPVRRPDETG